MQGVERVDVVLVLVLVLEEPPRGKKEGLEGLTGGVSKCHLELSTCVNDGVWGCSAVCLPVARG